MGWNWAWTAAWPVFERDRIRAGRQALAPKQPVVSSQKQRTLDGCDDRDYPWNTSGIDDRRFAALCAAPDSARGGGGGAAEAEGRAGVVRGHGRAGRAAGAIPGGGGRGHAGAGGLRHGGREQSATTDHPCDAGCGAVEGGLGRKQTACSEPGAQRGEAQFHADKRERDGDLCRV